MRGNPGRDIAGRILSRPEAVLAFALAGMAVAGIFLPPLAGRGWAAAVLAAGTGIIVFAARNLRTSLRPGGQPAPAGGVELGLVAAVTVGAAALRLPALGSIPPGLIVDEAYHALQGIAAWSGEVIEEFPQYPYPTWPVWWVMTAAVTRILGVGVAAARIPAALIGVLTVPLAWYVGRALFGRAGGIAAALFVAGSFWHVHYSRLALPWVTLAAEGLVAAWLLLGPKAERWWAGALAGAVSGVACYGYTAAFYLPLWGALVLGLKIIRPETGRRPAAVRGAAFAAGFVIVLAPGIGILSARSGARVASFIETEIALAGKNEMIPLANLVAPAPDSGGQWSNYPVASPRLSPVERAAALLGLACLIAVPGLAPARRWSLVLWLPLALLPEMVPGEVHLARGLGAVAPLAVLAALAGKTIAESGRRGMVLAALGAGALNAGWTAKVLFRDFPRDPRVRSWYGSASVEAAAALRELGATAPLEVAPRSTYRAEPVMRLLLWRDLREGRIVPLDRLPSDPRPLRVFEYPLTGEPLLILMGTDAFPHDRRVVVASIMDLLEAGREREAAGDIEGAVAYYRGILERFPDSNYTKARLAEVLGRR